MELLFISLNKQPTETPAWLNQIGIPAVYLSEPSSMLTSYPLVLVDDPLGAEEGLLDLMQRHPAQYWVVLQQPSPQRAAQLFQLGADDVLMPPIATLWMQSKIQAFFRRQLAMGYGLRYGDFFLETHRKKAYLGLQELPLSPTEFLLLQELVMAQGHLVPEASLLKHCSHAALPVHLHHIRHKLGLQKNRLQRWRKRGVVLL